MYVHVIIPMPMCPLCPTSDTEFPGGSRCPCHSDENGFRCGEYKKPNAQLGPFRIEEWRACLG